MFQSLRKMWMQISIILILIYTLQIINPLRIDAVMTTEPLTPEQLAIGAAMIGLTGIIFDSTQSLKAGVYSLFDKVDSSTKAKLNSYDGSGTFEIAEDTWLKVKQIAANDLEGTIQLAETDSSGTWTGGVTGLNFPGDGLLTGIVSRPEYNGKFIVTLNSAGPVNGKACEFGGNRSYINGNWEYYLTLKVDGVTQQGVHLLSSDGIKIPTNFSVAIEDGQLFVTWGELSANAVMSIANATDNYDQISMTATGPVTYDFITWDQYDIAYGEEITIDDEYMNNPAWDMGGSTINNITNNYADYLNATPADIAAGAVDTSTPVPVPETDGTEIGLLGGILQYLAQIRNLISNQSQSTSTEPQINDQVPALGETFAEKSGYTVFKDTWQSLKTMNTAQGNAPQIKINLHQLIDKSVGTIHASAAASNPFTDEEKVIFDFADFEDYSWGGFNLIQIFRILVGFSMVYSTIMMAWRRIIPDKVIS